MRTHQLAALAAAGLALVTACVGSTDSPAPAAKRRADIPASAVCTTVIPPFNAETKGAILEGFKWPAAVSVLRVYLMGGSAKVRSEVQAIAPEWNRYSRIQFQFVDHLPAEVRVTFDPNDPNGLYWSEIGMQATRGDQTAHTMNLGLSDDEDDREYHRVILHEFGHALGMIHEHQNPNGGIHWDEAKVYAALSGPPNNWDHDKIYSNVIAKYTQAMTNSTQVDDRSIMMYSFPRDWTTDGYSAPINTELSETDKQFIATIYPASTSGSASIAVPAGPIAISFDEIDVPPDGHVLAAPYLSRFGISVTDVSADTAVVIQNRKGSTVVPTSAPNVLAQINSNNPVSFTLVLPGPMRAIDFQRPGLVAGPTGITFPAWRVAALGRDRQIISEDGEPPGGGAAYYRNVPAKPFHLDGPGITALRFSSQNGFFTPDGYKPWAAFSAVIIDDLVLSP